MTAIKPPEHQRDHHGGRQRRQHNEVDLLVQPDDVLSFTSSPLVGSLGP
ncbi:hypothetical protein ACIBKY_17405 [Nonomuraea sp. NPDC050394]